ncbi:hypothetical protein K502DRAFT_331070 [Neoconidiobolus thromboides FSU 785]|nr:hypothetical protein K502DRAFT_331070 [Neoconidiobolus thromboides FSU 785]
MTEKENVEYEAEREEEEQIEKGERGEAQKEMKNMSEEKEDDKEEETTKNNYANRLTDALKGFKADVVKQKVRNALLQRELDKTEVKKEDVAFLCRELAVDEEQATLMIKKVKGDLEKLLGQYINFGFGSIPDFIATL